MHFCFRRLGQTEYLDIIAEDRPPSDENPRTFLAHQPARQHQRCPSGGIVRMHTLRTWQARASGVLLHGTGTGTADELTFVNNHCPSIFLASPSRPAWLLAVQDGRPVVGSNDTSK